MKILVTGASGFVGKNLIATLDYLGHNVLAYDRNNTLSELDDYCAQADVVVHLAGINRPTDPEEFQKGNVGFTEHLCNALEKNKNKAPILVSSSIQAVLDNEYGRSKREGESVLINHMEQTGAPVWIYRFSNLFGKWSRPHYNTVIATWCHAISRNEPIQINDPNVSLNLMYIDDVVLELIRAINGTPTIVEEIYCTVPTSYDVTLGEIADLLYAFKASRDSLFVPNLKDGFEKKLYSTYLAFLPKDKFNYFLDMKCDDRGSFTEFLKSPDRGQVSINISKPGITKGNHWHHSKNEKFLVFRVKGVSNLEISLKQKL
ncbi:NAD-dependent epimerase/dehydratase family protein [Erysipelothrix piscisicarius]|uniref:NAD-dependent epimerase/dehydratase family protein n=1 Tax=Erysipelothrix piscisicarius TaxID=2485784 RepID=UPI002F95BB7E